MQSSNVINIDTYWSNLKLAIESHDEKGIDANITVIEKYTAITPGYEEFYATCVEAFKMAPYAFPQSGLIWDKQTEEGDTLLNIAIRLEQVETVRRLIINGAFVHIKNKEQKNAVDIALSSTKPEIMGLILLSPVINLKIAQKKSLLKIIITHLNNSSLLDNIKDYFMLLQRIPDYRNNIEKIQTVADQVYNLQALTLFVSYGAKINPQKVINQIYHDHRFNFAYKAKRASAVADILFSAKKNQEIDFNIIDSRFGNTLLIEASETGDTECVLKLLEANADVSKKNFKGKTALTVAIEMDRYEKRIAIINALLTYQTNFDNAEEEKIYAIVKRDIKRESLEKNSDDLNDDLSCLNILYEKTKKEIYKAKLAELENQFHPTPKEVGELVTSHLGEDVTTIVQRFLFFSIPKPRETNPPPVGPWQQWRP